MAQHVYKVGDRITYAFQLHTPAGSIGRVIKPGVVTALLADGRLMIDLDGDFPPFQVQPNDPMLSPA